jgi:hypothetical protein
MDFLFLDKDSSLSKVISEENKLSSENNEYWGQKLQRSGFHSRCDLNTTRFQAWALNLLEKSCVCLKWLKNPLSCQNLEQTGLFELALLAPLPACNPH